MQIECCYDFQVSLLAYVCRCAWFHKALPITSTDMGNKSRMIPRHDPIGTPKYSQMVNYRRKIFTVYRMVYYSTSSSQAPCQRSRSSHQSSEAYQISTRRRKRAQSRLTIESQSSLISGSNVVDSGSLASPVFSF